jgi:hypothetical protein
MAMEMEGICRDRPIQDGEIQRVGEIGDQEMQE